MPRVDYEKLLNNISIEEIAHRLGMTLKKTAADQFKSLCPFHDDKTPSLLIDTNRANGRQHFHCFSCGEHGDAIDLVKKKLNLGFKDAVEWLDPSQKTILSSTQKKPQTQKNSLAVSYPALQFGYNVYKKESDELKLNTWISQRKLSSSTAKNAGLTYASRHLLSRFIEGQQDRSVRREYSGDLEDALLIRKIVPGVTTGLHLQLNSGIESANRYSDFFIEDRIILPINDEKGQLVGLAGRATNSTIGTTIPKYQLTRELPKSSILYRADSAFKSIKAKAKNGDKNISIYLCEGFFDALRFESLGIPAVAVMGSSISDQQVKLLLSLRDALPKDTTLTVTVSFDRDEAGLRGAADACLKLMNSPIESAFLWPSSSQLENTEPGASNKKDPDDYLQLYTGESVGQLLTNSTYPSELAVLGYAFGTIADEILDNVLWESSPRARRYRAFNQALSQLEKAVGPQAIAILNKSISTRNSKNPALIDWISFINESSSKQQSSRTEDFLNNAGARLNHSRILAYMGSRRGELPCDEPRWERLDIAATAFNTLLTDRLDSSINSSPIGAYNAVWVPRSFGGSEYRLKIMPRPEDLVIQQYLLNEILTERWDQNTFSGSSFSQTIPAVRYYREDRKTITTGFDSKGNGTKTELTAETLSFAYQIDMDVLEGRQPATDQGMYRPYSECWREFMASITNQAKEIGTVHSIRLDVKRYYDRLRRYVVRDRLLAPLETAIASVTGNTPEFAELLNFETSNPDAATKASAILDRLDEHLFGVNYSRPDTGIEDHTAPAIGIPQGPVLSAWIGTVALFPVDEEAHRFMTRVNIDRKRVGYARYVDDIVLLADDPVVLADMREAVDQCARKLELTLLAKADEIPAMSPEDFSTYINQGRALAASGPAWEPPLVGDGESGWDFWSVAPATDRQSALQLLHNVELYKASKSTLLKTVRTAFQAPDLRASELPKAARLIWYAIAVEHLGSEQTTEIFKQYLNDWDECIREAAWSLYPAEHEWESPILFALEGLEHLLDKQSRDIAELTAEENSLRRKRIVWLAELILSEEFESYVFNSSPGPKHQLNVRLALIRWKSMRLVGKHTRATTMLLAERSKLVQNWQPFEWMHEAVALLSDVDHSEKDPLVPFVVQAANHKRNGTMSGFSADVFSALLPSHDDVQNNNHNEYQSSAKNVALQTLVSIVPKEQLPTCLSRRPHLIWASQSINSPNRVILPPLPGINAPRLYSCVGIKSEDDDCVIIHGLEALDFSNSNEMPIFFGSHNGNQIKALNTDWSSEPIATPLNRLEAKLANNEHFRLREFVAPANTYISEETLKLTAKLYRSIAKIVTTYSESNEGRELVPAWPYIANDPNKQYYYLIAEGVARDQLGSSVFVRDGGRALRTAEVPIYEANLWRVGVAVSDYLGLHDDFSKFSSVDTDISLDAAALANPARYVLRSQLRKLRGAYADSKISKRRSDDGLLPATVARSLRLLETFPEKVDNNKSFDQLLYVLTAEAESAGMYLAFREQWENGDGTGFLISLVNKVLSRLPLSIGEVLSTSGNDLSSTRRDLVGQLCFARRLFSITTTSSVTEFPAWKALLAGIISSGIATAFEGLIASLRSHGSYERDDNFNFPDDWNIPLATERAYETTPPLKDFPQTNNRIPLIEHCRHLVQHLGHRIIPDTLESLPQTIYERLASVAISLASIENTDNENDTFLEWPFDSLSNNRLALLNLELLESVKLLINMIDEHLGFEPILVIEKSYGYNPQTKRFTDSRNGVRDVTPWMISQFPRIAKHIEEISHDDQFLRVWTEVFDRASGKLLSVSALGEPFASIAISKPNLEMQPQAEAADITKENLTTPITRQSNETNQASYFPAERKIYKSNTAFDYKSSQTKNNKETDSESEPSNTGCTENVSEKESTDQSLTIDGVAGRDATAFRKQQSAQWTRRGEECKPRGLVRIALLQADFDLTYQHPLIEASPTQWPFCAKAIESISLNLKTDVNSTYECLLRAAEKHNTAHIWNSLETLPSWAEHRRRAIIRRAIDACQNFGVDLLILPEYSVRRETIDWIKTYIQKKKVSVLAGTYMNACNALDEDNLAATLTLLWPLPQKVSSIFTASLQKRNLGTQKDYDALERGHVLEFPRNKKYRSIALEEFFRPSSTQLKPLFNPSELSKKLEKLINFEPTADVISHLLTESELPLKHFMELICSEAFLVSSPANYIHMSEDLKAMWARFGRSAVEDEVMSDIKALSERLSITGDGKIGRRSILAVPAATSRSADYWFVGQGCFLAGGTTTVFCNSIDGKTLVGGSCFIGRGSWKSEDTTFGYLSKITPYHGWSKGIYYNNREDALSPTDQALVIADVDPHNMLEGKPRAQTMPSPLQLVAYLPLIETIDWPRTQKNLIKELPSAMANKIATSNGKSKKRPQDEEGFWKVISRSKEQLSNEVLDELWQKFPDPRSLSSRAEAYRNNGDMQPTAPKGSMGILAAPALYDWIDVSLTLHDHQELPTIVVPPWKLPLN